MVYGAIRLDVGLIDEVPVALEPIKVPAASMLAIVRMKDPSGYLVVHLPTLNGFGTWRVRKVDKQSLVQTKEFTFSFDAIHSAEAKMLTR